MKNLLLHTVVAFVALLPIAKVQAGGTAATYGGLAVGATFQLKMIDDAVATYGSASGGGETAVPAGMPNFKKDEIITLTIGKKGALTGTGFSVLFQRTDSGSTRYNYYQNKISSKGVPSQAALQFVGNQPNFLNLVLRKTTGSGLSTKVYQVMYLMEKAN